MTDTAADDLFRRLDRELWLLTVRLGDQRGGLIASSVMSASIATTAPRVLVGLSHQHATWELVERTQRFCLQLLSPESMSIVERFGLHSARQVDKFAGWEWNTTPSGQPLFAQAIGWLDCRIEAAFDIGDRTLCLAAVEAARPPAELDTVLTVQQFVRSAPPDWLPKLRQQLTHDAAVDLTAIDQWRAAR